MNLLKLSWKNVWFKPLSSGFTMMILALGVGLLIAMFRLSDQVKAKFENNMAGVDMVVGAKGSPLQLILSALFHIDVPTGNISQEEADKLKRNRFIRTTIPLSYGDSYQGFRIVGTDTSYVSLYKGEIEEGSGWTQSMDVVLGHRVAQLTGLTIGDSFVSAHGLEAEGMSHDEENYRVVGILAPSSSVLDQLILTPTESVWHVHGDHEEDAPKEITALLVKFGSPMGMIQLPRMINQNTNMQAALPAYEINKLFGMLGIGFEIINFISYALIIVAAASLWVSMIQSLSERSYELALLRTYGASRWQLFWSIQLEALWLVTIGYIMGLLISQLGLLIINQSVSNTYGYQIKLSLFGEFEAYVLLGVLIIGTIAAALPAMRAAFRDISGVLAER